MVKELNEGEKLLKEEIFKSINNTKLSNKSIVMVLANLLNGFKKIK